MQILEAFDLTRSYRDAGELAGCSPNTVAAWVAKRDAGGLSSAPARRPQVIDDYLVKVEEWVELSFGKVRADVCHRRLVALGYTGSERTTRRGVEKVKEAYRRGRRRVYRPWVPEPGMWMQFDWGDGPVVGGVRTWLFCCWLAWSRYRVIVPVTDKTLPTLVACVDRALQAFGGVPTYALTDNERTVTCDIVARIPVRHPLIVELGRHYGLAVHTCVVADPESKGGSEATVRVAKADIVPTDANLLPGYSDFKALEAACAARMDELNTRPHSATRRPPADLLAVERAQLHRLPAQPFTACFGVTRTVERRVPVIRFEGGEYSVPHELRGEAVWVRNHGAEVVVTAVGETGAYEVVRHERTTPGNPRYFDEHFGPAPETPLERTPRARIEAEAAFLAIGAGAALWLTEAAAVGTARMRAKMADAVTLAALRGADPVDRALHQAALLGRFADGDTASILEHQATAASGEVRQAGESRSLQPGTASWEGFGR